MTDQQIELRIIKKVVDALLTVGSVSVYDGEEFALRDSTNEKAILAAMQSTDDDVLYVANNGKSVGWVHLVYGNGEDVICDHTTSLSELLDPIVE